MDSCLDDILAATSGKSWRVVVRPHPQYVRRNPGRISALQNRYEKSDDVIIETDFADSRSLYASDVMITDWSGVAMESSFVTHRPCVFINTPMKVLNPEYTRYESVPMQIEIRNKIGVSMELSEVSGIAEVIGNMLNGQLLPKNEVARIAGQYVYNPGTSGQVGGRYILEALRDRQGSGKSEGKQ